MTIIVMAINYLQAERLRCRLSKLSKKINYSKTSAGSNYSEREWKQKKLKTFFFESKKASVDGEIEGGKLFL